MKRENGLHKCVSECVLCPFLIRALLSFSIIVPTGVYIYIYIKKNEMG